MKLLLTATASGRIFLLEWPFPERSGHVVAGAL